MTISYHQIRFLWMIIFWGRDRVFSIYKCCHLFGIFYIWAHDHDFIGMVFLQPDSVYRVRKLTANDLGINVSTRFAYLLNILHRDQRLFSLPLQNHKLRGYLKVDTFYIYWMHIWCTYGGDMDMGGDEMQNSFCEYMSQY